MIYRIIPTLVLLVYACAGCDDWDSSVCVKRAQSNPGLCQQPRGAAVCPRFCGFCPLKCYNCAEGVNNCSSVIECKDGEQCVKTVKHSVGGQALYFATCASKTVCEGDFSFTILGRRHEIRHKGYDLLADRRGTSLTISDVLLTRHGASRRAVHECCSTDLCNHVPTSPPSTVSTALSSSTTTGIPQPTFVTNSITTIATTAATTTSTTAISSTCQRDLTFLIQDTKILHDNLNEIEHFLLAIVRDLNIPQTDTAVGLSMFEHNRHNRWELGEYRHVPDLNRAISSIRFADRNNVIGYDDILGYISANVQNSVHGDRPDVKDVVVIIADTHSNVIHDGDANMGIQFPGVEVIVVTVGPDTSILASITSLATDQMHALNMDDYRQLPSIVDKVLHFVCS